MLLESVLKDDASLGSHNISSQESIAVQTERAGASQIPQSSVTAAASASVSAQAASVASAKSIPPSRPNPRNQRENPSKTNENRRVSSSGTLQKGPQPLVATANAFGALAEMDLDVPDDQDFLTEARVKTPAKNVQANKQTSKPVKNG
jgi:hypothetical protein